MAVLNSWQKISRAVSCRDFGDGSDGSYSSSTTPTITYRNCTGTQSSTTLSLSSSGYSNGQVILIHQTWGTGHGQWEINRIVSGGGSSSLTLQEELHYSYISGAQVINIPLYSDVTQSGTWSPTDWNSGAGGIFAFACNNTVTIGGTIELNGYHPPQGGPVANGGGFRGGSQETGASGDAWTGEGHHGGTLQQYPANGSGGGGGSHDASGGGGGGNASSGQTGSGYNAGVGGEASSSSDLTNMDMGGGGGGGSGTGQDGGGFGGNGGGLVAIFAKNIVVSGAIQTNGGLGGEGSGSTGCGGGGGAGGSILLVCNTASLGSSISAVKGENGYNAGDGSNGVIAIHHSGTISGSTSPTYNNISDSDLLDGQINYAKAWIVGTKNENLATGDILRIGLTDNNSSKSNIVTTPTKSVSSKAYIPTYQKGISARASIKETPYRKSYDYRVYDNNTYVTTWSEEVISDPSFRAVVNGGPGEMIVKLARHYDDFGEEVDVKLFNTVELWCFDKEAPNGILIYSGFISGYRPVIDGHTEYVEITLLHQIARMSQFMLRDEVGDTEIAENSIDPSDMFKAIIDYYRADGGVIGYTDTSIVETNSLASYTFSLYTIKEALDKVIELAPENWFWRIDADNIATMNYFNIARADHSVLIGKNVSYLETWRRAEDMINRVYFVGQEDGAGIPRYYVYSEDGSVNSYGIHATKYIDQRVSLTSTAALMSNIVLDRKADPEVRTLLTITDSNGHESEKGYDIESIKPGQSIQVRNLKQPEKTITRWDQFEWDVDVWDQTLAYSAASILQIISIEYTPSQIKIEASSKMPEISKRMEEIYRNWELSATWNVPSTPS